MRSCYSVYCRDGDMMSTWRWRNGPRMRRLGFCLDHVYLWVGALALALPYWRNPVRARSEMVVMVDGNAMTGMHGRGRASNEVGRGYFRLQQRGMRQ